MKPFKSTTMLRPLIDAELQMEDPQWEDDDMLRVRRWKNIFIVKDCLSLTAIRSAHLPA